MIVLHGFGPGFGLPEISPYVTKTEVQLKMAGLVYRKDRAIPTDSPKGQLPFIDDGDQRIADSTFIRGHIERRHGVDFDAGLNSVEHAQAWAFERMIESHVIAALVGARWLIPDNFARGPVNFFNGAPEQVRAKVIADALARVAENYRLSGLGRHTPEEALELSARSLSALSLQLGDKPHLMGSRPSGVDAVMFGAVAGILTPFFDSPLRQRVLHFDNLVAYADRMMAQYYPEHPWQVRAQAA